MLENQGLNQHGSQLEQTFCLDDKENIPPPSTYTTKKKIASKIKKQKKIYAKVKVPYSVTKVKARNLFFNVYSFLIKDFNPFFWIVNLTMKMIMKWF